MSNSCITYNALKPTLQISPFVESFWMLQNQSDKAREVIILPDGRIDLFLSQSALTPFHVTLKGIETQAIDTISIEPHETKFAISFNLLAVEYIFQESIANLRNEAIRLPDDFWEFNVSDLIDFEIFCKKATQQITAFIPSEIDNRKCNLFDLIYTTNGAMSVQEISESVFWSSRQINRYFKQQFGLTLKAYCSILRFRASFQHLKEGKLFPQENFTDQAHFIKEVKKHSGSLPKELYKNQNDRFIQFSKLDPK